MAVIKVELGDRSYEIVVESGSLVRAGDEVASVCKGRAALIVTEPNVGNLYGQDVITSLSKAGFQTFIAEVPGGEECKTLTSAALLYDRLVDICMDRTGVIVTLGGGVVGDIGGFVAATYLRGVDFVQIPTTLLAQVDAGIGGKVAVDLPRGKNLVGAFYQPKRVLIDPDVLVTLPRRQFVSGLAELIKHGIILDQGMFEFVRSETDALLRLDRSVLDTAIAGSCEIKAAVVASDETESGLRAVLNFGHTVGHALEAATGYRKYTHGETVSIGMVTAALISEAKGMAPEGTAKEIAEMMSRVGLPIAADPMLDIDAVMSAMVHDKKFLFGRIRFVLLRRIGQAEVVDTVTEEDVRSALAEQARLFGEKSG